MIFLKHLGIIAPVQQCAQIAGPEHEVGTEHSVLADQEYVIPCVLRDAKQQDLKVQIQDTQACSIVPLRIFFGCGFSPMGGFCYLFSKLISNNKKWKYCLPDKWADENNIYYRNKVTFKVKDNYFVTLLSSDKFTSYILNLRNLSSLEEMVTVFANRFGMQSTLFWKILQTNVCRLTKLLVFALDIREPINT